MILLSAKPVLEKMELDLKARVMQVTQKLGRAPCLAAVLVGEDPASQIYVRNKEKKCLDLGIIPRAIRLPGSISHAELTALVRELNGDKTVDGILVQRPLPKIFPESEVMYWVKRELDVDAFHPENTGRLTLGLDCFQPCTPSGVMEILKHYGISVAGKTACVIGRSSIVGKPMAALLLQADATVIQVHSKTPDIAQFTRQADILVVAAGRPGMVGRSEVKPGAVVVDVGIHKNAAGKTVGDVRFDEVKDVVSAITPVPGGVGPMTIGVLMRNTVISAELRMR